MVYIIDQARPTAVRERGERGYVQAHLVEHLIPLLEESNQSLSPGAKVHDADRINALNQTFVDFCEKRTRIHHWR